MKVFVLFEHDGTVFSDCPSLCGQQIGDKRQEGEQKEGCIHQYGTTETRLQRLVVDVVLQVQCAERAAEHEYGKAENLIPGVAHRLKSMPGTCPRRDGSTGGHGIAGNGEFCTIEECAYGYANKEGAEDAVEYEEAAVAVGTEDIAGLRLEFIGHCLKDEGEENEHPHPVCPAERGAVEEGKRCEECAAEGDEGGESKLPFAAGGIDYKAAFGLVAAKTENLAVGSLHEGEEYEESGQEADQEPPVLL